MRKLNGIFLLILLSLLSCSQQSSKKPVAVAIVKRESLAHILFYAGIVQPIHTVVITSPAEGTVIEMPFRYGELVKARQLLFMISSSKFMTDYKTGLLAYVKSKNEYNNAHAQLTEAKFLHKHKLISDDDFKMKKSNYYASRLSLLQAKDTLEKLLQQLDIKNIDLYQLTIADIDKITAVLQTTSDNLRVLAPLDGMILSPNKNEENKKIVKGDVVKQGDVLAILGDMHGMSVRIKVNELTVNQLKIGQKVKVTGISFSQEKLEGEIKQIDKQGEVMAGGMPTFEVKIVVPHLTEKQQRVIHVGMSANLEINISEPAQLTIPLKAITEKNGEMFVNVYDNKTNNWHAIAVKTGNTTTDNVAILSGLKTGDKIALFN